MARRTQKSVPRDPYWDVVQSLMQNILTIYEAYRDKKPVMLFDMQEHPDIRVSLSGVQKRLE